MQYELIFVKRRKKRKLKNYVYEKMSKIYIIYLLQK